MSAPNFSKTKFMQKIVNLSMLCDYDDQDNQC